MILQQAIQTISNILYKQGYEDGEIKAITRITLEEILKISSTQLLMLDKGTTLKIQEEKQINSFAEELAKGIPIQYILGKANFYKHSLIVSDAVLIPRPETEELCQMIINTFDSYGEGIKILDIGTGSGCIAYSLAYELTPKDRVDALDISDEALKIAQKNFDNMPTLKAEIKTIRGDVFNISPPCVEYDIIVSNPPYIMVSEKVDMKDNVKFIEPEIALFAPEDNPTAYYKAIAKLITRGYLKKGGSLWLEINPLLCQETAKDILSISGISSDALSIIKDMSGKNRFIHIINR